MEPFPHPHMIGTLICQKLGDILESSSLKHWQAGGAGMGMI